MDYDPKSGELISTLEEISLYNMMLTEAMYQILSDKGILTRAEVTERINKLKSETKVNIRHPKSAGQRDRLKVLLQQLRMKIRAS